jgi:hypothetical protein
MNAMSSFEFNDLDPDDLVVFPPHAPDVSFSMGLPSGTSSNDDDDGDD